MRGIRQFSLTVSLGPGNPGDGSKPAVSAPQIARAVCLSVVLVLSGCELLQRPAATEPGSVTPPARAGHPHAERIAALLDEASAAFADNRLTTPVEDSAYTIYLQVLSLDPTHAGAEQGIADIVERYLEWAISNAADYNIRRAVDYLGRARSVAPEHPNIAAVAAMLEERKRAHTKFHPLEPTGLRSRSGQALATLQSIGAEIGATGASAVIVARSDAEGRWMYQQLNDMAETRVRAELRFGEQPGVRLIYPVASTQP